MERRDTPAVVPVRDGDSPTAGSTEELPPGAADDRQARPAEHRQHQQGGLAESKLAPARFTPWQYMRARKNFAVCWQRPVEEVTLEFVEEFGSSLGVAGWADPNLR